MKIAKMTRISLLLALAMVLGYIESLIPFFFGIPGMKLGLANLMTVLVLFAYSEKEAILLNILRITLLGFLFGNLFGIVYSMTGAVVSFAAMVIARRLLKWNITWCSIMGGIFHNVGQVLLACLIIENINVLYYLPGLLISGLIAGFLIGILGDILLNRGIL